MTYTRCTVACCEGAPLLLGWRILFGRIYFLRRGFEEDCVERDSENGFLSQLGIGFKIRVCENGA